MTNTDLRSNRLYRDVQIWLVDHKRMLDHIQELVDWLYEQYPNKAGSAIGDASRERLREANSRLLEVRLLLLDHFDFENSVERLLAEVRGASAEVEAVRHQTQRDQQILLKRLERLINTFQDVSLDVARWHDGAYELNLLLDLLEQHEEQKSESISWLLPREDRLTLGGRNNASQPAC